MEEEKKLEKKNREEVEGRIEGLSYLLLLEILLFEEKKLIW